MILFVELHRANLRQGGQRDEESLGAGRIRLHDSTTAGQC